MPKGGKRAGAGRKPRQDGRESRSIRVALTKEEYDRVIGETNPDTRRERLLRQERDNAALSSLD